MPLLALNQAFETLQEKGEVCRQGWTIAKVTFEINLSPEGEMLDCIDVRIPKEKTKPNKKTGELETTTIYVPKTVVVPMKRNRSGSKPHSGFLHDNPKYYLSLDDEDEESGVEYFEEAKSYYHEILDEYEPKTPEIKALLNFFDNWNPREAKNNPILQPYMNELLKGANIVFCMGKDELLHQPELEEAWDIHEAKRLKDAPKGTCMVTREYGPLVQNYPFIKGVKGAPTTGVALISANHDAFWHEGYKNYQIAPISEKVAFNTATALNYFLAHDEFHAFSGDSTLIFWSQSVRPEYPSALYAGLTGSKFKGETKTNENDETIIVNTSEMLQALMQNIVKGRKGKWSGIELDPDEKIYVLCLSPTNHRLCIRFFFEDSFGNLIKNINQHYEDIAIAHGKFDDNNISTWSLINETVKHNADGTYGKVNPKLPSDLMQAILNGTRYPSTLLKGVMNRISCGDKVSYGKASIIKGYYTRHEVNSIPKEVLDVTVKENTNCVGYNLGRLFAIYEWIQDSVGYARGDEKMNKTIADKFFVSAPKMPDRIFSFLTPQAHGHLSVIRNSGKEGLANMLERRMQACMDSIGSEFPKVMSVHDQNIFYLGYYLEREYRYTKHDKESENIDDETESVDIEEDIEIIVD